ncbi:uncharacterized protein LOC113272025 [Papaver somniferum]|uniref:uncharacterized protein LOC113272025 n=1 Tax=Papaver somniferum TaxID=3469 RepID=UPI000E6F7FB1|nr:uncharacterized protein LOC113272025 [Papaver somniferum]
MKESETIQVFFSRASTIINQIQAFGDTIAEKKIVEKLLRSLPFKFEHVVAAIEESKDISTLSMYEMMGSLEAHEQQISRYVEKPIEQAFQSKLHIKDNNNHGENGNRSHNKSIFHSNGKKNFNHGGKSYRGWGRGIFHNTSRYDNSKPYCNVCKKSGHESENCRYKCTICKKLNHIEKDCWSKQDNKANFSEKDNTSESLLFSCFNSHQEIPEKRETSESPEIWYLDSGCSNHMTGDKTCFVSLDENINSHVKLGDGNLHKAEGKGVISVSSKVGHKLIHDVLYVPGLAQNLLSVGNSYKDVML